MLALITGAGSGIGRALALALCDEISNDGGASLALALADIDVESARETLRLCEEKNADVEGRVYGLNVADHEAVDACAVQVERDFGRGVSMLVNNAGVVHTGEFTTQTREEFNRIMRVNFDGVVNCTRAFLPQLKMAKRGYLINISSMFGIVSTPGSIAYQASKFAVRAFTEVLQIELADCKTLSVHSVHPGFVSTGLGDKASGQRREETKQIFSRVAGTTPEQAAAVILKGVRAGHFRIMFTPEAFLLDTLVWFFPNVYRIPKAVPVLLPPILLVSKLASKLRDSSFGILGDRGATGIVLLVMYGLLSKAAGKIMPRSAL